MEKLLIYYIVLINIITFIIMYIDKQKAIKGKYRISEKTLIYLCVLGGSLGELMGMYTFRHKTKHRKFTIGVPILLVINILVIIRMVIVKLYI